jgi:valine--pyruvate aminotransferase
VRLSRCGSKMTALSGLRSIMEDVAVSEPDGSGNPWLNLGIGNPAVIPEAVATWQALTREALESNFTEVSCRYGPSRGTRRLVDAIAAYFRKTYGWDVAAENVIVGPGSQMLCFIAAALFAGPGEAGTTRIVLPSIPDYAGYQGLCMQAGGLVGVTPKIKLTDGREFVYSIDHQALSDVRDIGLMLLSSPCNPTGHCVDAADMEVLIGVAVRHDSPVLIDHAYGAPFPRIVETLTPPVWHENVINCFSVSKAGLPGERIGFAIGPSRYIGPMVFFIANTALHAPQLTQDVLASILERGYIDELASTVIRPYYLARRQAAEKLLAESMPESVEWRIHESHGGMFCWLWVNEPWFDDAQFYQLLKRRRVIIVPGRHFFADPQCLGRHGTQCFRVSVTPEEPVLREGIRRIGEALEELRAAA